LRRSRRNRRKLKLVRSGGVGDASVSSTRDGALATAERDIAEGREWRRQNETANRDAEVKALEDRWAANSPKHAHDTMVKRANRDDPVPAKRDEGEDMKTNSSTWKERMAGEVAAYKQLSGEGAAKAKALGKREATFRAAPARAAARAAEIFH